MYISSGKFLRVYKRLLTLGEVIDKAYAKEIIVIMTSLIEPIKIKKGQKIAQLVVKFLNSTKINNKGFGEIDEINFIKRI